MMKKALIVAAGDFGMALALALKERGYEVTITQRHPPSSSAFKTIAFDYTVSKGMDALREHVTDSPPDLLINTIGMLHDEQHQPEKTITRFDEHWFMKSMEVNCLTHVALLSLLSQVMPRTHAIQYVAVSARVGSIEDNRLGGWMSYRCSKAALNMAIKTTAIEWRMRFPKSCVIAYHPGSVDTKLSKPFHGTVKTIFSPEEAALYLLSLIDTLTPEMSGYLYDWQHERIAF